MIENTNQSGDRLPSKHTTRDKADQSNSMNMARSSTPLPFLSSEFSVSPDGELIARTPTGYDREVWGFTSHFNERKANTYVNEFGETGFIKAFGPIKNKG